MTLSSQEAAIAAASDSIGLLARSDEASALMDYAHGSTEADNEAKALAFIAKAAELGLAPDLWFCSPERGWRHLGPLPYALSMPNRQRAIKALVAAGASPWPGFVKKERAGAISINYASSQDLANLCFDSRGTAIASRKVCLARSLDCLDQLPESASIQFMIDIAEAYAAATRESSLTSSGVMGPREKHAKICAEIALASAPALRFACATRGVDAQMKTEAMLTDAAARLAAKKRDKKDGFDPEAIKKTLAPARKARLKSLGSLIEYSPHDPEAAQCLLDSTPWLSDIPQILCVNLRGSGCVAALAILHSSLPTLVALDRLGSNIWLASAQNGSANACEWAAHLMVQCLGYRDDPKNKARVEACVPAIARLLAYGAFLDGADDPISHAVAKTDEALLVLRRGYRGEHSVAIIGALRSAIERLALADLLAGRDSDGSEGEGEAPPEPPKRRARSL